MGLFSAVDKVQLATGALYGFNEDNNLHGQQYSWLGSILSLGVRSLNLLTTLYLSDIIVSDACRNLALNLPHPSTSRWQVPQWLFHVLVSHDFMHCGLP